MSPSLTNEARALAVLGHLELTFERSEVPLPPKKRSGRGSAKGVESAPPQPSPAELEYVGPKLPRWVEDGVPLRVKVTPWLREHGLATTGGAEADNRAWPKEVGTIRRREGNGWWEWIVQFSRGRHVIFDDKTARHLKAAPLERSAAPSASARAVAEGASFEEAIVADALEVVDAAPHLPAAADVRVYLRAGRKYIRVFWVRKSAGPDAHGSVLHFVDKASGQLYTARSHRSAGRPTGRFIPSARSEPVEVWERDRVVWFRAVDSGHRRSRVELRRGDTAWVSLGKREGERRGYWASVNGISRARRELKMDAQWIDLRLVYSREEAKERSIEAPALGSEPAAESPFGSLLEGLRTRRVRKLRVISTDATPHDMRVTRVVSHPGGVVAEGTIKRSKARLTISTAVDAKGRPTQYARLRRGSRDYRVDARRITAVSAPSGGASEPTETPAEQPAKSAKAKPGASQIVGLPQGTKLHRPELFSSWGGKLALVYRPYEGGFDPNAMKRTYSVRFAIDDRSKKPLRAASRYVGVEPYILDRRVAYEETGFTVGTHGARLEGTFAPLQQFEVALTLRELTDAEHRELAEELLRREFLDTTGYRFGKKQWRSLLGRSFTEIQDAEEAQIANEVDRFVTRHFDDDSPSDAVVNARWREVARRGVFATTRQGRVKFIVHGFEPSPAAAPSPAAPSPAAPSPAGASRAHRETAHQRARRERAERKAARLERLGEEQWASARAEMATIPMGQPILVGHHSEQRHRNALKRLERRSRQALDTLRAAEAAHDAAARAGYAISSDDPDALEALEARLAELEASRELGKAINRAYRKGGWDAVEQVPGVTPAMLERSKQRMKLAHWLKTPMNLTNLSANVRRVRKRIEQLGARAERSASAPIEGEGFAITEHVEDNRIRFTFAERPDKPTITKMKRAGFRWSRRHGAWQRQLNDRGRHAAWDMAKELFGWERASGQGEPIEQESRAAWQARAEAEAELEQRERSRREQGAARRLRRAAREEDAAHGSERQET